MAHKRTFLLHQPPQSHRDPCWKESNAYQKDENLILPSLSQRGPQSSALSGLPHCNLGSILRLEEIALGNNKVFLHIVLLSTHIVLSSKFW